MNDLASPYCINILVYICSYIFIYGYILAYKHAYVSALGGTLLSTLSDDYPLNATALLAPQVVSYSA